MRLPSLSLVFPAYNEEANVDELVAAALKAGQTVTDELEVIVVNDGSRDQTAAKIQAWSQKDSRVRSVDNEKNLGYGRTVWNGLQAATKDWVFFSDADLQFDLKEIRHLTAHSPNFDVVIGYRAPRRDPLMRLVNAKSWNMLVRLMFGLKIKDLDCAFKLFRRRVLTDIEIQSGGATFSAELMTRLQQRGITFKEVPVTHLPRQAGSATGAKPAVIIRAFKELFAMYRLTDLARPLWRIFNDLWRFAAVGVISTLIDIVLLNFFLNQVGLALAWAIFWAYGVGAINGYLLNNRWTYHRLNRRPGLIGLAEYVTISFVGLGLTELIIHYLIRFGLNVNLDKIIAVFLVFLWNFFGNRWLTFRSPVLSEA